MKKYKVYIQDNFVGEIEADNTGQALAVVAKKLEKKEFVSPNENISPNVRVEPVNE